MHMFKKQSFNTGVAYVAPLCEALEFKVNEGVMILSNQGGGGQYGDGDTNNNGDY